METSSDVLTTGVVIDDLDGVVEVGVLFGADVGRLVEDGALVEGAAVEDGGSDVGSLVGVGVALVSSGGSVDGSAEGVGVSEASVPAPVPLASCRFPCTFRYSAIPSICKASSILMAVDKAMMAKRANKSHDCRIVLSMAGDGFGNERW